MRNVCPARSVGSWALLLFCSASCVATGRGSVVASVDNDSIDKSGDDHYSSGLALAYVSELEGSFADTPLLGSLARELDEHWPFDDHDQRFVIYSLSHRLFTPSNLSRKEVVEDDLPYSAMFYARATVGSQSYRELTAFSLVLGFVGPWALGEEFQSAAHAVFGSSDPQGWDHQLDNEPLLNVELEHRRRLWRGEKQDGFGGDLLASISASAGNLQTQATVAATVRTGYRLPSNFHMQTPFLGEESLGLRSHDPLDDRSFVYAFASFAAAGLANAIYLDGNTFSDSHSVDHDHHVLRGSIGLAGRHGPILASASYELMTLPWDPPDGQDDDYYLRLNLSWDF